MKNISQVVLLLLVVLVTFHCTNKKPNPKNSTPGDEKNCIEHVIAIDDSIGGLRNHNCEKISLSETIKIYTDGIENISFDYCPRNFSKAFEAHKKAWVAMMEVTDKYPDLRGEMHDLFKILEEGEDKDSFKPLLDKIWSTWADVEKAMGKE